MSLIEILSIIAGSAIVLFLIYMLYAFNEDWISKIRIRNKVNLFLSSIKNTDKLVVTLSYSNEYRTRIYCFINKKYITMEYSDFKIDDDPKECDTEDLIKIINYIYTTTGYKIEILDLTTETKVVTDKVKLLNKNKVTVIENKSSELLDEYGDPVELNKLN